MAKTYYKVCREQVGMRTSVTHSHSVTYDIGLWTYPKVPHSKLFEFDNLKDNSDK